MRLSESEKVGQELLRLRRELDGERLLVKHWQNRFDKAQAELESANDQRALLARALVFAAHGDVEGLKSLLTEPAAAAPEPSGAPTEYSDTDSEEFG